MMEAVGVGIARRGGSGGGGSSRTDWARSEGRWKATWDPGEQQCWEEGGNAAGQSVIRAYDIGGRS